MSKRGKRRQAALANRQSNSSVGPTVDARFSKFHYTTAAGLIGIITTRTLWATHANFLNDTAECQLLSRLLTPQVEREFSEILPRLITLGAFKPELLDSLSGNTMQTEAEKVTSIILKTIERVSPIYITSFCMHEVGSPESEHGLLSQWRGYGRGGFAVEFDERELDLLTNEENQKHSYQVMATRRVEYENHEAAANLSRFDGIAAAFLKVAFEDKAPNLAARPDIHKILGDRHPQNYIRAFVDVVPFLKSPRFKEENEYRIVALATRQTVNSSELDGRPHKQVRFREGAGGTVVPYISLFEGIGKLPIKKIIVGPHRDQENQFNAARLLLDQNGMDVPIVRSDTTLRF